MKEVVRECSACLPTSISMLCAVCCVLLSGVSEDLRLLDTHSLLSLRKRIRVLLRGSPPRDVFMSFWTAIVGGGMVHAWVKQIVSF